MFQSHRASAALVSKPSPKGLVAIAQEQLPGPVLDNPMVQVRVRFATLTNWTQKRGWDLGLTQWSIVQDSSSANFKMISMDSNDVVNVVPFNTHLVWRFPSHVRLPKQLSQKHGFVADGVSLAAGYRVISITGLAESRKIQRWKLRVEFKCLKKIASKWPKLTEFWGLRWLINHL